MDDTLVGRKKRQGTQGRNPVWGRYLRVPGKQAQPCGREGRQWQSGCCWAEGGEGWFCEAEPAGVTWVMCMPEAVRISDMAGNQIAWTTTVHHRSSMLKILHLFYIVNKKSSYKQTKKPQTKSISPALVFYPCCGYSVRHFPVSLEGVWWGDSGCHQATQSLPSSAGEGGRKWDGKGKKQTCGSR